MGRPRIYDEPRVVTAIRLSESLRAELRAAAAARHVSVNLLVTNAVADFLRRDPSPGRPERSSPDRAVRNAAVETTS
jgi:hypothetical protein